MLITIFVSDKNKIEKVFNKIKFSNAIDVHKSSNDITIRLEYDELRITVVRDSVRGMRHNYVFIDKDIDNELVECLILPKVIPIYTIFGAVDLERYYEFIDVDNWDGMINKSK